MASPHSSHSSGSSNPFAVGNDPAPPPASTLAMLNIRSHVTVVLNADDVNFRQWRNFFELTLKKFGLLSHIDGTVDAAAMIDDPEWLQIDSCIVSWLYITVSKEIWSDVNKPGATAYSAWTAITGQFLDNSLQRAVYAQQEFHSLFQGDMSIGEYCGCLKSLADTLYDCGAAVSDPALVINTLRGLNNKFSQAIAVLSTLSPSPTFLYTRSYLLQEEHRIKHSLQMEAQTAMIAAATSSTPTKPAHPSSPAPNAGGGDRRKKHKSNDGRNRQNGNGASGSTGGGHTASPGPAGDGRTAPSAPSGPQWSMPYNPWQGVVQAWPMNTWRPGTFGPRPGVHPPQAMAAISAPPQHPDPASLPAGLYSAMNGLSLNNTNAGGGDWFLDTGATAHMASNSGSPYQDGAPPM